MQILRRADNPRDFIRKGTNEAITEITLSSGNPQRPIVMEWQMFSGVLYLGVIATGVGWLLWMAVVSRVSATLAGMSSLGVPALTVLLAWLLLDEWPTQLELMGTGLILLGLFVVNWPSRSRKS